MGGPRSEKLETQFRDNRWPKRSTKWVTFLVGFWGTRPIWVYVGPLPLLGPIGPKKTKMAISQLRPKTRILYNQLIDISLLSNHKKFQPEWPKYGWVIAKETYAHIRNNFCLTQPTIDMKPSLFVKYYQITYSLLAVGKFLFKCGWLKKRISVCNFYPTAITKKASRPTFFNISTWLVFTKLMFTLILKILLENLHLWYWSELSYGPFCVYLSFLSIIWTIWWLLVNQLDK